MSSVVVFLFMLVPFILVYVFHLTNFSRFSVLVHQNLFSCTIVEMHIFLLIFITILFLASCITAKGNVHCNL